MPRYALRRVRVIFFLCSSVYVWLPLSPWGAWQQYYITCVIAFNACGYLVGSCRMSKKSALAASILLAVLSTCVVKKLLNT